MMGFLIALSFIFNPKPPFKVKVMKTQTHSHFLSLILFLFGASAFADSCRIVDYGGDMGSGFYRNTSVTQHPEIAIDVDGDSQTSDDCVAFWDFSLSAPINPDGNEYDTEAPSAILYGGLTAYFADATDKGLTEGLLNENHERRDDYNMMVTHTDLPLVKAYGFWFWKKEDFLNGGDAYTVTFDADSKIAPHISRYYDGIEAGRWVARDGTQFYISEKTFADYQAEIGRGSPTHTSYVLSPNTTNWAPYDPVEPYQIEFDAAGASYAPHTFTDVTAVGFYLCRDTLQSENIGVKWHSFECYAQVSRPAAASYYTAMADVPSGTYGGSAVTGFSMGETEVSYALWKRVWKWAVSNQFCFDLDPGYCFDRDGDMGSMDYATFSHTAQEPAADMTWYDAVLWCNALSELEGYTPCYYADASKTQVLRGVKDRYYPADYNNEFNIYVDWSADGFRLPTQTEWSYAAEAGTGSASSDTTYAWTSSNAGGTTHETKQLAANAWGLYDMIGNVWEYTWDTPNAGDHFDPSAQNSHTVMGGGFLYPEDRTTNAVLPYGDTPYNNGSCIIGLRLVRSNTATPPADQLTGGRPPVRGGGTSSRNIGLSGQGRLPGDLHYGHVSTSGSIHKGRAVAETGPALRDGNAGGALLQPWGIDAHLPHHQGEKGGVSPRQ